MNKAFKNLVLLTATLVVSFVANAQFWGYIPPPPDPYQFFYSNQQPIPTTMPSYWGSSTPQYVPSTPQYTPTEYEQNTNYESKNKRWHNVQEQNKCGLCGGHGQCIRCDGMGRLKDYYGNYTSICPKCNKTGKCTRCNGSGLVMKTKSVYE